MGRTRAEAVGVFWVGLLPDYQKLVSIWRSLAGWGRTGQNGPFFVRDEAAAGSNPASPTTLILCEPETWDEMRKPRVWMATTNGKHGAVSVNSRSERERSPSHRQAARFFKQERRVPCSTISALGATRFPRRLHRESRRAPTCGNQPYSTQERAIRSSEMDASRH